MACVSDVFAGGPQKRRDKLNGSVRNLSLGVWDTQLIFGCLQVLRDLRIPSSDGARIGYIELRDPNHSLHTLTGATFDLDQRTATFKLRNCRVASVVLVMDVFGPSSKWSMSGRSGYVSVKLHSHTPSAPGPLPFVVDQPFERTSLP